MPQNWNNVLQHVKANFGTKTTMLEITDDEFFEYFQNHSLPYFSQLIPHKAWVVLSQNYQIHEPNTYSNYTYKLKVPEEYEIIDIQEVYFTRTLASLISSGVHFVNPLDTVIANTYNNIYEHLTTVNDYTFIRPDIIRFSEDFRSDILIIELNVEHTDLRTIPSDMYHKLFKPICLMNSIELVLNNRNNFTNITTPFGEIDLNTNKLEQKLQELRQQIDSTVDRLPLRKFVEFF